LRLEAEAVGDALVETAGEGKVRVELRLAEGLGLSVIMREMTDASSKLLPLTLFVPYRPRKVYGESI
jgi:hypothetical protein